MNQDDNTERLVIRRSGENSMEVEIVGDQQVLMSMIHAALINHQSIRKTLIPVLHMVMKDDDFLRITLEDMMNDLSGESNEETYTND